MSSRRLQGFSSHRGVHGKLLFAVRSKGDVMAEGGKEDQEVIPGVLPSGGLFHGEVTRGRGADKPVAPCS